MDKERADRQQRTARSGVERSCAAAPVCNPQSAIRNPQSGWALLTVMFFAALLVMTLAYSIPRTIVEAKREKEARLLDYGKEYQRAIGLYFRKFQRYPAKIEDLEGTNNIRFLRKRFPDPVTGSKEWRFLHVGPGGAIVDSALQQPGQAQAVAGMTSAVTVDASGQLTPSGQTSRTGQPPGPGQPLPQQPGFAPYGQPQPMMTQPPPFSQPGQQPARPGMPGGPQGGPAFGQGGATMGAAIAGVASTSTEGSIKLYNARQKYNEWEFVYDFSRDPFLMGGIATGAQIGVQGGPGRTGQPFGSQPSFTPQQPFGQQQPGYGPQQPFGPQQPGYGPRQGGSPFGPQQPGLGPQQPMQPGMPDQRRGVPPGPIRP